MQRPSSFHKSGMVHQSEPLSGTLPTQAGYAYQPDWGLGPVKKPSTRYRFQPELGSAGAIARKWKSDEDPCHGLNHDPHRTSSDLAPSAQSLHEPRNEHGPSLVQSCWRAYLVSEFRQAGFFTKILGGSVISLCNRPF